MTAASREAGQRVIDLLREHDLGALVVDMEETAGGYCKLTVRVWVSTDRIGSELRRLGEDAVPPLGWDARTLSAIRAGFRSRVWPFLIAVAVGLTLGAIARWL